MDLSRILNPVIGVAGLLSLALSATLALAESNETIKIKVKTVDGIAETVVIDNLEVGMTDVFVTESGKEVLITRDEGALTLEIEGKTIDVKMPNVQALHSGDSRLHKMMFVSEDSGAHKFSGEGDHFFSCSGDSEDCGSHGKVIVIGSDDLDGEMNIEDIDGANVIVKRIHLSHDGDTDMDMDELLSELEIEVENLGDGAEDHEVIVIKRQVEIHEDTDDN